jgi:two-component system, NtrC family, nitrogen regulation response regulator GlnG
VFGAREEEIDAAGIEAMLAGAQAEAAAPAGDQPIDATISQWLHRAGLPAGDLYHAALATFEKPLFEFALHQTGGNQLRAANLLGINRNTLHKRLVDLDIDPDRFSRGS